MTRHPGYDAYDHRDEDELTRLLVGRRVERVDDATLRLDDGTLLELRGNVGCSGRNAGDYELTQLSDCDNVITRVEVVANPGGDDYDRREGTYEIFVYAANELINLATFEGSDGNGYYGTGFTVLVTRPRSARVAAAGWAGEWDGDGAGKVTQ